MHILVILKNPNGRVEHRILVETESTKDAMTEVEENWVTNAFEDFDFEITRITSYSRPKNKDVPPMPASGASCL